MLGIIEDEADRFYHEKLFQYCGMDDEHKLFKNDLQSELYNYNESVDKLIYLYRVSLNIDNEYEKHLKNCPHKDNHQICPTDIIFSKKKYFVEQEIKNLDFNHTILRPQINSDLIKKNLVGLKIFPESGKLFQDAIEKLNGGKYDRNLLDDLRLSLEELLREILKNNKSLEKQKEDLGKYLENKGMSKELRNMFISLVDCFTKFQNNNVKHGDKVDSSEVDFLVNISSAFINYLISK